MRSTAFFDAPEQQSLIKTKIVTKYFSPWSSVMIGQGASRLAYIDLFAGPGVFTDGTPSTPIWILNHAIKQESLRARLVTIFNDKNSRHAERLQSAIDDLPGIETLAHRPQVSSVEIGSDIVSLFRGINLIPTLFFIDPWGYKGLSLDLIGTAIKNWGCECIFFFNYNRINAGLDNAVVANHMSQLFGPVRFERLRAEVTLENVKTAIKELEAEGRVAVDTPADKRPKRNGEVTLGDNRIVTFPD